MRQLLRIAPVMALLLASCADDAPAPQETLVDVRTAPVVAEAAVPLISAAGTVELRRETALGFTTAGQIARITVNEGDRVVRGQLLAALDTTNVDSGRAAADAEVRRAAAELARTRKLFAQGWVTRVRLDNAEAAYSAAAANARASDFAQDTARIVAPSSGVILARSADPSQVVQAGQPVLVLGEESSGYILRVPIPDGDATRLRSGAPATARIAALGDRAIAGTVLQIGGRADAATGTFAVEVALPPTEGLRSGQIGSVDMVAGAALDARASSGVSDAPTRLLIPAAALFSPRADEGFVYVLPAGSDRVVLRTVTLGPVRPGAASDAGFTVLSGVRVGERVVVSGVDRLTDGQRVRAARAQP